MTLCAGTCCLSFKDSCTITLSESLLKFRSNNELKETLLHEMIHGYLFITNPKACDHDGKSASIRCLGLPNNANRISLHHSFLTFFALDIPFYFRLYIFFFSVRVCV